MNEDLMKKAKSAKSAEELRAIAEGVGLKLTEEAANEYYAKLHGTGELEDEELDNVAGGGCGKNERPVEQNIPCPDCSTMLVRDTSVQPMPFGPFSLYVYSCPQCGKAYVAEPISGKIMFPYGTV